MNVFIAGPRAVSVLNNDVKERLQNIINRDFTVIVGDANGVDKQIQQYCYSQNYNNVKVFSSNGKIRNNIGQWKVVTVEVEKNKKGFDFYAAKDLAMAKTADYGFMIWNGKSKGTFNNIINLLKLNKKVLLYFLPKKEFYTLNSITDIDNLVYKSDAINKDICIELMNGTEQISFTI
jgi:hypothetical protein